MLGGGGPENVKGLTIQLTIQNIKGEEGSFVLFKGQRTKYPKVKKVILGTRVVDLQKCGIANRMNREWKKAFGECEAPFVSSVTPVAVTFPVMMSANRAGKQAPKCDTWLLCTDYYIFAGNDEEENMDLM